MKNFRFDTICDIAHYLQELQRYIVSVGSSTSLCEKNQLLSNVKKN